MSQNPSPTGEIRKTPLHAQHVALGAKMVAFAGYDMPVQYPAGVLKEHNWTRTQAGLFDVSHMGQARLVADDGRHETAARALESVERLRIATENEERERFDDPVVGEGRHRFPRLQILAKRGIVEALIAAIVRPLPMGAFGEITGDQLDRRDRVCRVLIARTPAELGELVELRKQCVEILSEVELTQSAVIAMIPGELQLA